MLQFLKRIIQSIRPPKGPDISEPQVFWRGVFFGLLALSLFVTFLSGFLFRTGLSPYLMAAATMIIGFVGFWVFRFMASLIHVAINNVPTFVFSLILGTIAIFSLAREMRFGWPQSVLNDSIIVSMLSFGAFAGSLLVLFTRKSKVRLLHIFLVLFSVALTILSISWILNEGRDPYPISFEQTEVSLLSEVGINNPGVPGDYSSEFFTYGNGSDIRRPEYAEVKYKTETVDASKIITDWKGKKAKWRKRYWGFSNKEFPLNGRVWMPEGEGTFPLILIVHGNHGMEHHSDPGYAYLGELLSSRGFITVSVDENFINGTWSGDFRGKEMPARAWILLKHLEQWRNWSNDPDHELYQKADLNSVMLMGHSRGGEAMPIAVTYNRLTHFPDDASVEFDFDFGIKGVAAIAPTDARYFRRLELEDVNYFSIQGSYDSDEASFFGLRQYHRVNFSDSSDHFKAGLYVHLANHGQFNSIWGRKDAGLPYGWFLNTGPMMSGDDQREIAKVYLGAYAEAVLHGNRTYLPLFNNAAVAKDWLPDELMINNYSDANTEAIQSFGEDVNLTSGTEEGSTISGNNLKIWREEPLKFRDNDLQGVKVAVLGWAKDDKDPYYELTLKYALDTSTTKSIYLSLARGNHSELKAETEEEDDLDFTIELIDEFGNTAYTRLGDSKKLAPRVKVKYMKIDDMNGRFGSNSEATLETFHLPLSAFDEIASIDGIQKIRLRFDQTQHGVLIVNEIGVNHR